jgi:hypothetical protein
LEKEGLPFTVGRWMSCWAPTPSSEILIRMPSDLRDLIRLDEIVALVVQRLRRIGKS